MTSDPFEKGRLLEEAEQKRFEAAETRVSDADVECLKKVLAHLPLLDPSEVGNAARKICLAVELGRQEMAARQELLPESRTHIRQNARKPLAGVATDAAADWFWILTGKAVTRVSKGVDGKLGLQETGDFAKFLSEVLDVFGIQASTAAQVKMWKTRVDAADLKKQIHPTDLVEILNSPEALEKLLQELRSADQSQ